MTLVTDGGGMVDARHALAARIDAALVRPEATEAQILRVCDEARLHRFANVCVNAADVGLAVARLAGSGVGVCTVVGFPFGGSPPEIKAAEAARAISDGAVEIDMVLRVGALKSGRHDLVRADIAAVRAACPGAVLKVALECCLLDDDEKRAGCRIAVEAGADFVKTSTGFSAGGATIGDVQLLRDALAGAAGVKAAGGIRSARAACAMIEAGADRIGTSSGVTLVTGTPPSDVVPPRSGRSRGLRPDGTLGRAAASILPPVPGGPLAAGSGVEISRPR